MARAPVVGVSFAGPPWAKPDREVLYLGRLRAAGAEPLVARPPDAARVPDLLRAVDAWLFTGGNDISPELYGEPPHPTLKTGDPGRDRLDMLLARAVLAEGVPVLGICLGHQILNVAAGGSLHQDIPSLVPGAVPHADGVRHRVRLEPGTRLAGIVGEPEIGVNSFHHQGVNRLGRGFRVAARAEDGVVEAIEREAGAFAVGVQWHPERDGCARGAAEGLFEAFVAAAAEGAAGRNPLQRLSAS